jgi:DNA-nicking Smr family endonuclease/uncharacterized protein YwbE
MAPLERGQHGAPPAAAPPSPPPAQGPITWRSAVAPGATVWVAPLCDAARSQPQRGVVSELLSSEAFQPGGVLVALRGGGYVGRVVAVEGGAGLGSWPPGCGSEDGSSGSDDAPLFSRRGGRASSPGSEPAWARGGGGGGISSSNMFDVLGSGLLGAGAGGLGDEAAGEVEEALFQEYAALLKQVGLRLLLLPLWVCSRRGAGLPVCSGPWKHAPCMGLAWGRGGSAGCRDGRPNGCPPAADAPAACPLQLHTTDVDLYLAANDYNLGATVADLRAVVAQQQAQALQQQQQQGAAQQPAPRPARMRVRVAGGGATTTAVPLDIGALLASRYKGLPAGLQQLAQAQPQPSAWADLGGLRATLAASAGSGSAAAAAPSAPVPAAAGAGGLADDWIFGPAPSSASPSPPPLPMHMSTPPAGFAAPLPAASPAAMDQGRAMAMARMHGVDGGAVAQLAALAPQAPLHSICELLKAAGGDLNAAAEKLLAGPASSPRAPAPASPPPPPSSPPPQQPSWLAGYPAEVQQLVELFPALNPSVALQLLRDASMDVHKACDALEQLTGGGGGASPQPQPQPARPPSPPQPQPAQPPPAQPPPPPAWAQGQGLGQAQQGRGGGRLQALLASGLVDGQAAQALGAMSDADLLVAMDAMGLGAAPPAPAPPARPPPTPPARRAPASPPRAAAAAAAAAAAWAPQYTSVGSPAPAPRLPPPPPPRPVAPARAPLSALASSEEIRAVREQIRRLGPAEAKAFVDEQHQLHQRFSRLGALCSKSASGASASGDHTQARLMQQRAEEYRQAAAQHKARANSAAFRANNRSIQNTWTLDMHGLHVAEALEKLGETIRAVQMLDGGRLEIITGKGRNSREGQPQIKAAVMQLLGELGLRWAESRGNSGKIEVMVECD